MTTTIDRRKVELLKGSTERRSFGAALEVRKSASGTHLRGYASTFEGVMRSQDSASESSRAPSPPR